MDRFEKTAGYVVLACLCLIVCILTALAILVVTDTPDDNSSYAASTIQSTMIVAPAQPTVLTQTKTPQTNYHTILEAGSAKSKRTSISSSSTVIPSTPQVNAPSNQTNQASTQTNVAFTGDTSLSAVLQSIFDAHPEKMNLPVDTAVMVSFFGRTERFLLKDQLFSEYHGEEYDIDLKLGDYYLDGLRTDFCGTVNRIALLQDYKATLNKDKFSLLWKYGSLLSLRHMCD